MILLLLLVPLILTLLVRQSGETFQRALLIIAPLPALLVSLVIGNESLNISWLLLGLHWELTDLRRTLLIMTSSLWLIAGISTAGSLSRFQRRARYLRCWLLTLSGNTLLLIASDIMSFYTFFALMTFAAYGLVIHSGSNSALRAGKIYLIMALIGEAFLLSGLILAASLSAGGTVTPLMTELPLLLAEHDALLISAFLFLGFGVKVGVAGIHMWLPLAHPAAPTAASAVLSGAMIKTGLFGWLTVLPMSAYEVLPESAISFSQLGTVAIGLGLLGAFGAGVLGVMQTKAKTVLAYSSVSQMGLMTLLLGVALLEPNLWPSIAAVIIFYAVHHGFAKGVLFLSVGISHELGNLSVRLLQLLSALPAAALIGAPFTSGMMAKYLLKENANEFAGWLYTSVTLSAIATAALMARYLWLLGQESNTTQQSATSTLAAFWAALALALGGWLIIPTTLDLPWSILWEGSSLWSGVWPIALVALVSVALLRRRAGSPAE
ncbi:MAG: hypothetical protein JJU10_01295 [Idiomarina sp.]|nr:hypothetical protein [Idiomarina sp.]